MTRALQPTLRKLGNMHGLTTALQKFTDTAACYMEPLIRFQKQVDRAFEEHRRFAKIMQPTAIRIHSQSVENRSLVRYVPEVAQPRYVELSEAHVEVLADRVVSKLVERNATLHIHTTSAQIDLVYDRKTHTLTRHIGTTVRSLRFDGRENNKRRDLFEKLIRAKSSIGTHELKTFLNCTSTDATYKVIEGLNGKMTDELGLTMNIANGSDKSGYRIDRQIAVHEV